MSKARCRAGTEYARIVPAGRTRQIIVSIVIGLAVILRRNVQSHRAWIARGYVIGLGAATQMLVLMVAGIVAGAPNQFTHDLLMALSWVINLAVAEWAIRTHLIVARPARRART